MAVGAKTVNYVYNFDEQWDAEQALEEDDKHVDAGVGPKLNPEERLKHLEVIWKNHEYLVDQAASFHDERD